MENSNKKLNKLLVKDFDLGWEIVKKQNLDMLDIQDLETGVIPTWVYPHKGSLYFKKFEEDKIKNKFSKITFDFKPYNIYPRIDKKILYARTGFILTLDDKYKILIRGHELLSIFKDKTINDNTIFGTFHLSNKERPKMKVIKVNRKLKSFSHICGVFEKDSLHFENYYRKYYKEIYPRIFKNKKDD